MVMSGMENKIVKIKYSIVVNLSKTILGINSNQHEISLNNMKNHCVLLF